MMPGMNPRKMQQMMKKMGIAQTELDATEVIIKCEDKEIVITNPSVAIVKAMGSEQYTISGDVEERELAAEAPEINEEDVKTVMEQANVDEEKAKEALEAAEGDIAKAIMDLQG
ncbi:MAG: nascent polypeptide-associated complex protein [Candidatus Woesearchaeota archaeon]